MAKKDEKKESIGSKIMSGIKSIGSNISRDIKMGTGLTKPDDDYRTRTKNTRDINRAIASGNTADLIKSRPDLADRIRREELMNRMGSASDNSGIASLKNANTTDAQAQADQYAENLRRYEEYMKSQQPKPTEITPDMRQAALQTFESQRGAGQMPYYMAAAAGSQDPNMSPAFQYAAQNYATLGGSQRLGPRPMEMMSVAERRQVNDMAQAMADQAAQQQAQQMDYQRGMDMVMRGGGKGGGATMPQGQPMMPTNLPPNFASMLSQRFGGFGG